MAYKCPHCGKDVQRGSGAIGGAGGLVGMLIMAAFAGFHCPECGKVPRRDFPPEARTQMLLGSVGLIVGAIVVFILVIALLVWISSWNNT
jgi:DNA-directed RNA polymerase subunit RPC12/RpoP